MRKLNINLRLFIIFLVFLTGLGLSEFGLTDSKEQEYQLQMLKAVELSNSWFKIIDEQKKIRGIESDAHSNVFNNFLIGNDFSTITTTLGSLNAKEISTNPDFAALIIRLIKEANIPKLSKIGIIASGSFPALTISTLAALQTLDMDLVLMSSLGASTYGANQVDATWIDLENWLIDNGNLKYRTKLITRGAENDNGLGLLDEGIFQMEIAVKRNQRSFFVPENLAQSIEKRVEIFKADSISLLINIGGNQAAMGRCAHSLSIPNGYTRQLNLCKDKERGVIQEINALGIPIINLLNIKELANRYGMDISPGTHYSPSQKLYKEKNRNKPALAILLLISMISFYFLKKTN